MTEKTSFTKIRLNPAKLTVDIGDLTFATSTGGGFGHGPTQVNFLAYAYVFDCVANGSQSGTANIDLTGTPFAVGDTFITTGFNSAGSSAFSASNQVVDLTGGGFCGGTRPTGAPLALFTSSPPAPGGFTLDLAYTGPLFVHIDIDIKPNSDPSSFGCDSKGGLPVAVLGSATFVATAIDAETVRFGRIGNEAAEVHEKKGSAKRHVEDFNKDGFLDMIFHFSLPDTDFSCSDRRQVG